MARWRRWLRRLLTSAAARRAWGGAKLLLPEGSRGRQLAHRLRSRLGLDLIGVGAAMPPASICERLEPFERWLEESRPRGLVVILASTQLREDEGQRSTHLALEFARRGLAVFFAYWRWNEKQWLAQDRLGGGIFQWPVDLLARWPEPIFRHLHAPLRLALFEFPHPSFFRALGEANGSGWITLYDVVDDWEDFQRVGQAHWYDRAFEEHLLAGVDAVTAVSEPLRARVEHLAARRAALMPNAYAPGLGERPPVERAEAGLTLGYFGYLAGAWFDWSLIVEAARARPQWRIELIGYGGEPQGMELPANVHLLGRQPRRTLASFAARWDVAVVPFIDRPLARAADPIKAYEYLALGLPVVLTGVQAPPGAQDLVARANGLQGFLQAVEQAAGTKGWAQRRMAFAQANRWESRVDALLDLIRREEQGVAWKTALFAEE